MSLRMNGIPCHYASPTLFSARAETRRETSGYVKCFEKMVWWNCTQIFKFTISHFMFLVQQPNKPPEETDMGCIMIKKPFFFFFRRHRSSTKSHHNQKPSLPPSNLCHYWAHHFLSYHVHWQHRHLSVFSCFILVTTFRITLLDSSPQLQP